MRYDKPELMRQLAAEYVIGTLQGAARKRFEALVETNDEARFQRDFWEQRLAEFGQVLHPVSPPVAVRSEVLRRAATPDATPKAAPAARRWHLRRRHRAMLTYVAGFATAASLVVAFLLGQRNPVAPPAPSMPKIAVQIEEPAPERLPMYAAQVRMPSSSMGWLLSVTPDHQRLVAVAADDLLQIGRHRLQLWCVVPGAAPVPMGELPVERDASAEFEIPVSVRGHAQVSFIVTLEPEHGPGAYGPAGPVMHEARSLTEI